MKIERISKAVIHATSLPMYSGKPVIWCWEATTPSWVLSHGLRHATNISFFLLHFNEFRQFNFPHLSRYLYTLIFTTLPFFSFNFTANPFLVFTCLTRDFINLDLFFELIE